MWLLGLGTSRGVSGRRSPGRPTVHRVHWSPSRRETGRGRLLPWRPPLASCGKMHARPGKHDLRAMDRGDLGLSIKVRRVEWALLHRSRKNAVSATIRDGLLSLLWLLDGNRLQIENIATFFLTLSSRFSPWNVQIVNKNEIAPLRLGFHERKILDFTVRMDWMFARISLSCFHALMLSLHRSLVLYHKRYRSQRDRVLLHKAFCKRWPV